MFDQIHSSENQHILLPLLEEKNIQFYIKREDKIHPFVSGNKFRKLKYNLQQAKSENKKTLLTFGGAYSNHIVATAVAGAIQDFQTIGVIRGDELSKNLEATLKSNATLRKASEHGMKFVFVSREQYRDKLNTDFLQSLKKEQGDFYLIPEGGTNQLATKGCEEILTIEDEQFDYICSCVGTGGSISGLIKASKNHQKILGFPALKGDFLNDEIKRFVSEKENWELMTSYHFGGYGKFTEELIHFINEFKEQTKIPLDPIYTGKMMFGIIEMIKNDEFSKGSKILAIHTGGLQGIEGFNHRLKKKGSSLKIHI